MKYLAPLLDIILGMLLAFISIAAVSGQAEQAEADDPHAPEPTDPVVLELRLQRPASPLSVSVRGEGRERRVDGVDGVDLNGVDEVRLNVADPALYDVLRQIERGGAVPRLMIDTD